MAYVLGCWRTRGAVGSLISLSVPCGYPFRPGFSLSAPSNRGFDLVVWQERFPVPRRCRKRACGSSSNVWTREGTREECVKQGSVGPEKGHAGRRRGDGDDKPLGSTQYINRVGFLSFSLHQEQKTLDLLHKRYMKERSERVERETITTSV